MTTVYLACPAELTFVEKAFGVWDWGQKPLALLFSFAYTKPIERWWERFGSGKARSLMLDSGAFSAWNRGITIDWEDYMKEIKRRDRWNECVALDVVGDGQRSLANAIRIRDQGGEVIPVFHIDEPWEILDAYCKLWPKVGLSCRFGETKTKSLWFYRTAFRRCWPHRFHSFGWTERSVLMEFPFESADSSSYLTYGARFAFWRSFGSAHDKRSIRGEAIADRIPYEMEFAWRFEAFLRERWRKELARWKRENPAWVE